MSPLHQAACHGHAPVITALIDAGSNLNSLDENSATPLHKAAYNGHHGSLSLLIQRGSILSWIGGIAANQS